MPDVTSYTTTVQNTQPKVFNALAAFIDPLKQQGKSAAAVAGDLLDTAGKIVDGKVGDYYSDAVHKASDYSKTATAAAGVFGGYVAGVAIAGFIGGLVGGILGAAVGAIVGTFVGSLIEGLGKAIAGVLGIDWKTGGKTSDGGTWTNVEHPDGTFNYVENGPDADILRWSDKDGYHETYTGKGESAGYSSSFNSIGGNSSFKATDTHGEGHFISNIDGSYGRTDTYSGSDSEGDYRGAKSSDGNGNTSDYKVYADGSSVDTEVTTNQETGDKTTTITKTAADGSSTSTTTVQDKDGNDITPPTPVPSDDDRPDDSGGGEGGRLTAEKISRVRPGHPKDQLHFPGDHKNAGDDRKEQPVLLRDVLAAMSWTAGPNTIAPGDASEESKKDDVLRMLRNVSISSGHNLNSGEDFINPKAKATLLNRMAKTVVG